MTLIAVLGPWPAKLSVDFGLGIFILLGQYPAGACCPWNRGECAHLRLKVLHKELELLLPDGGAVGPLKAGVVVSAAAGCLQTQHHQFKAVRRPIPRPLMGESAHVASLQAREGTGDCNPCIHQESLQRSMVPPYSTVQAVRSGTTDAPHHES